MDVPRRRILEARARKHTFQDRCGIAIRAVFFGTLMAMAVGMYSLVLFGWVFLALNSNPLWALPIVPMFMGTGYVIREWRR
jgi:hypothetical protein